MNIIGSWSFFDRLGFILAEVLLSTFWQSTVLFLFIFVVAWTLRKRSASVRHSLWFGALMTVPLLPFLTSLMMYTGLPQAPVPLLASYESQDLMAEASIPAPNAIHQSVPTEVLVEHIATPHIESSLTQNAASLPEFSIGDFPWALGLAAYVMGLLFFGSRLIIGHLSVRRWIHTAVPLLDERVHPAFADAGKTLGLKKKVLLLRSDHVAAPITAGAFRTAILVPGALMKDLSDEQLRVIALHESAHAKRRDPLVLLLMALVRTLFFIHPLVWLVSRHVTILSELAADEAVLTEMDDPVPYAKFLTRLAESLPAKTHGAELAAGILFSKSAFLHRIEAVLSEPRKRFVRLSRWSKTGTVLAGLIALGVAVSIPITQITTGTAIPTNVATAQAKSESESTAAGGKSTSEVIFKGKYQHRSRGGTYNAPGELVLSRGTDGSITATSHLLFRNTTHIARGNADHQIVGFEMSKPNVEKDAGYKQELEIEDGKVYRTQRGIREDEDRKEVSVPRGAIYDPNSRPDSYSTVNILFRGLGLEKGQSKELDVYDVDNSGYGYSGYEIKIENVGKETVEVPAGTFDADHLRLTQLRSADTWYKKRAGHVTDFWVLENGVIIKIYRHREPYELALMSYEIPETLPGQFRVTSSAAGLRIRAVIDGSDTLKIRGNKLWYVHHQWKFPFGATLVNGKEWSPVWQDDKTSNPFALEAPVFTESQMIGVRKITGRGAVTITEKPTEENEYTLSVLIDDGGFGGAEVFEFELMVSDVESAN
jgi:beta-lactamase regulating signal transducer with metallopeptidase domain